MVKCPKCGGVLKISNPQGLTTWQEDCVACGYSGGGTASYRLEDLDRIARDHQHNPAPDATAKRIVTESTVDEFGQPPDLQESG